MIASCKRIFFVAMVLCAIYAVSAAAQPLTATAYAIVYGTRTATHALTNGQTFSITDAPAGGTIYVYYTIQNTGGQTVTLTPNYAGCMGGWSCDVPPATIPGNGSIMLTLTFQNANPIAGAGNYGSEVLGTSVGGVNTGNFVMSVDAVEDEDPGMQIVSSDGLNITSEPQPYVYTFPTAAVGVATSREFTISPLTGSPYGVFLSLTNYSLTTGCFSLISGSFPASIGYGSPEDFRWRMQSGAPGNCQATITFTTNTVSFPTFSWILKGSVADIQVTDPSGNVIPNGGIYTFPTTAPNTPASVLFTISNFSASAVTLTNPTSLVSAGAFGEILDPSSPIAAFNTSTDSPGAATFRVRFESATAGNYTGTVTIDSNDPFQGTYSFTVKGTVS